MPVDGVLVSKLMETVSASEVYTATAFTLWATRLGLIQREK